MKKEAIVLILIIVSLAFVINEGIKKMDLEKVCIDSGGEVITIECCYCKDFQELATPNFLCFNTPKKQILTCACPEKTRWNGTACIDNYYELSEEEKNKCLSTGGKIAVRISIGGVPSEVEFCDCGENRTWDKDIGCYS